jgi:chromosome partitioning protein
MTRRIALAAEKGGVGKSTTAVNLGANLAAECGFRVLVVDCDHQANATSVLTDWQTPQRSLADVLIGDCEAGDVIVPTGIDKLDLLPSDATLAEVNALLSDSAGPLGKQRENRLRDALEPLDCKYDFVLCDTGPSRSVLNVNVLNYVYDVFVCLEPGKFSLAGAGSVISLVDQVRQYMHRDVLRVGGIVLLRWQDTEIAQAVEEEARRHFKSLVFPTTVPLCEAVEDANCQGKPVTQHAPKSAGGRAYLNLTADLLKQERAEAIAYRKQFEAKDDCGPQIISFPGTQQRHAA